MQTRAPIAQHRYGAGQVFVVRHGDSLSKLINEATQLSLSDHSTYIDQVLRDNPHITDPDLIHPGQIVFVRTDFSESETLPGDLLGEIAATEKEFCKFTTEERSIAEAIAPYARMTIEGAAGEALTRLSSAAAHSRADILSILDDRASGIMTSKQALTKARVSHAVRDFTAGPTKRILGRGPLQDLKANAGAGRGVRKGLQEQAKHAGRVAKIAKAGGYVMLAANLGSACHDISRARSNAEKNGLFVETGASMAAGVAVTAGVLLVSGPVGWGVALVIGAGSAVAGWAAGKGARKVYDDYGKGYDVVGPIGVETLCSAENFERIGL